MHNLPWSCTTWQQLKTCLSLLLLPLQVVVHNLPWSCTWQQLKDHFQDYNVERADLVLDATGRSRCGMGCGV